MDEPGPFSLLGMEPRAAFPIMVASGAFMGLVAAMRFVSSGRYTAPAALGLTFGGIPGVLGLSKTSFWYTEVSLTVLVGKASTTS